MSDNKKILSGLVWTMGEKLWSQLAHMVISIILARRLAPEHYGLISITVVFINVAEVFISSGFGNALIQKKDADEVDYSSIFWLSLGFSLVLYLVLFLISPLISRFYDNERLTAILRVMALSVPISALSTIQRSHVSKQMRFQKFFLSTSAGTLCSAVAGISLAYAGFGVWALVAQNLISSAVNAVVLWFTSGWKPRCVFNKEKAWPLFSYSWKLMLSQFLNKLTENVRSLIIGKVFSASDLAYYDRGHSYPNIISMMINSSVSMVVFPAASARQSDIYELKALAKRAISICVLIMAPLLFAFALCSESLVRIILTETWLPCIPYLQIYCVFYLFVPLNTINLQIIKAKGRSDLVLKCEVVKKTFELLVILFTVFVCKSVLAIAIGSLIANLISNLINAMVNQKLIFYGYFEQLLDVMKSIIPALVAVLCSALLTSNISNEYMLVLAQICIVFILYVILLFVFNNKDLRYLLHMIKQYIH